MIESAVIVSLIAAAIAVAAFVVAHRRSPGKPLPAGTRRILVPFTGGELDSRVLDAAIRVSRAEHATLVPAYLVIVPLRLAEDAPMQSDVHVALPLLEAVEHAALRAGIPVDARIEKGRTPTHALRRIWEAERFDRVIAPAPPAHGGGFTPKDLAWILTNAPVETLVLRPAPEAPSRSGSLTQGPRRLRAGLELVPDPRELAAEPGLICLVERRAITAGGEPLDHHDRSGGRIMVAESPCDVPDGRRMSGQVAHADRRPRGRQELVPALAVGERVLESVGQPAAMRAAPQTAHLSADDVEVGHSARDDHVVDPLPPHVPEDASTTAAPTADQHRARDRGDPDVAAREQHRR